jgi:hypothetical protein
MRLLMLFDYNQIRQYALPIKHNTSCHVCQLLRMYKPYIL